MGLCDCRKGKRAFAREKYNKFEARNCYTKRQNTNYIKNKNKILYALRVNAQLEII